ncbi:class I SAM-dependent methyltransferase [Agromyces cerinus]|uniref:Methyltransferase domain-containing protein n=1 Tax=Agromyces cerinus subsp. cerinus TaxID=232089 RepID=A0A1N6GC53_9MICO|nr:class I SAM-dependent methyltransferase [Agromyces cerinus]SIO05105.1 Methyltransferase domain-containing protein [Agromyces cerinus subsp. cerinus]
MTEPQHDATAGPTSETGADAVTEFADRVFASTLGGVEMFSIYLGDRLGWYRALAVGEPLDPAALAARTGTHERYAREWLEQQAVSGILTVDDADAAASARRFTLPPAHAEVLANPDSLAYLAPLGRFFAATGAQLAPLLDAYRTGGGVSWAQLGEDARDAQGDINRPWFLQQLGPALASVPSLHDVLSRPGARIADIGMGHGWSSIALAQAYPSARVEGFDVDAESVVAARRHADEAHVGDRVRFHHVAGEGMPQEAVFDAAFVFEALHDMPFPVEVLTSIRRAVKRDGEIVIMDEAVAEAFAPDGDDVERVMYGYSIFMCLPDGLSTPGSVGTGTVMRQSTLERYALEAGFSGIELLPIEGFAFFRFTRLLQ